MAGYVHVYTGDGKGKTTAAFGVAIRSLYAGKKVYIGQFVKSMKYHETGLADDFENIIIEQYGQHCFIEKEATQQDIKLAKEGLKKIEKVLLEDYDLVILDEVTIALYFKLFTTDCLIEILKKRSENVEVILTGRYAPDALIDYADLVTEMKAVKHYYEKGVASRDGIDR